MGKGVVQTEEFSAYTITKKESKFIKALKTNGLTASVTSVWTKPCTDIRHEYGLCVSGVNPNENCVIEQFDPRKPTVVSSPTSRLHSHHVVAIESDLRQGYFGSVFSCRFRRRGDTVQTEKCYLNLLPQRYESDQQEAIKLTRDHLSICKKLHSQPHNNIAQLVLTLISDQLITGFLLLKGDTGSDLEVLMRTLRENNTLLIPEIHLLSILSGVTAAAYHVQITLGRVLCELRPCHVLYDGGSRVAKIVSPGSAVLLGYEPDVLSRYSMAPEVLIDDGVVSSKSDIYGIGILMSTLMTFRAPFDDLYRGRFASTHSGYTKSRATIAKHKEHVFARSCLIDLEEDRYSELSKLVDRMLISEVDKRPDHSEVQSAVESLSKRPHSQDSESQELSKGSQHSTSEEKRQKEVLQQNIAEFLLRSEVKTGRCYASCNFAIGRFDREGGVMRFCGRDDIQLVIPPGCLNKEQMIYMKVFTDSLSDKHLASPVVECGPNGLQTKIPMQLRIPHVTGSGESGDSNILAASRPQIGEKWTDGSTCDGPQVIQRKGGSITLAVYHFTGFAAFFRNLFDGAKKLQFNVFTSDEHASFICCVAMEDTENRRLAENYCMSKQMRMEDWQDYVFSTKKGSLQISRLYHGSTYDGSQMLHKVTVDQICCLGGRRYYEAPVRSLEKADEFRFSQEISSHDFVQFVPRIRSRNRRSTRPAPVRPTQVSECEVIYEEFLLKELPMIEVEQNILKMDIGSLPQPPAFKKVRRTSEDQKYINSSIQVRHLENGCQSQVEKDSHQRIGDGLNYQPVDNSSSGYNSCSCLGACSCQSILLNAPGEPKTSGPTKLETSLDFPQSSDEYITENTHLIPKEQTTQPGCCPLCRCRCCSCCIIC